MKPNRMIGTIATIMFLIFATILIIQLILKLTGHSPTEIQLLYIAIGAITSYLLAMSYKLGVFVGEMKGFVSVTKAHMAEVRDFMGVAQTPPANMPGNKKK